MDEKIEEEMCQKIIKAYQELLETYVYVDIAKNPPDVGIPNYHHRKINLIEEIGNISPINRRYYEFYQEIKSILTVVRDGHFSISAFETPKGVQIYEYWAGLPFKYIIKPFKEKHRVFISIIDYYIRYYDKPTQEFLKSHLEIPIKSINDMDPFDYIQNWSKFVVVKNKIHSKFVNNLVFLPGFYLEYNPLNYSDFVGNEIEFDDNRIIRISYLILKPNLYNEQFKQFFRKTLKKYKNIRFMPSIEEMKNIFFHKNDVIKKEKNKSKHQLGCIL